MLQNLATTLISFGYIGVFLVMMANSDFLPLFTETTLPLAGFIASQGKLSVELIILASVLGDLVGGIIAYYVGYLYGKRVITAFIRKYRKYVLLRESEFTRAMTLLEKYGSPTVFFLKLIPGLKTYTSVAAGMSKIKLPKYIVSSVLASTIYNSILVILGFYLGKNWRIISSYFGKAQLVVIGIIVIGTLFIFNRRLKFLNLPLFRRY